MRTTIENGSRESEVHPTGELNEPNRLMCLCYNIFSNLLEVVRKEENNPIL